MKTVKSISIVLDVQQELVRDAAGELYKRCSKDDLFTPGEILAIRAKLASWGKIGATVR